jgi:hypothetical protein
VYWGGSDLGKGRERYPSQWESIPPGWAPGPEGPTAKPKVQQVLNTFVNTTVKGNVQKHMSYVTFKEFAWPTFASIAPTVPVVAKTADKQSS